MRKAATGARLVEDVLRVATVGAVGGQQRHCALKISLCSGKRDFQRFASGHEISFFNVGPRCACFVEIKRDNFLQTMLGGSVNFSQ